MFGRFGKKEEEEYVPPEPEPIPDGETQGEQQERSGEEHTEPPKDDKPGDKGKAPMQSPMKMFNDWLDGTEENPLPDGSLRLRFLRWRQLKYRGYVYLYTTGYNKNVDEYICRKELVHISQLERDAVPVTGEKKTYHWDLDVVKRGFDASVDNGFTAVDAYLYMKCNKIEEAMRIPLDNPQKSDILKFVLIAAGAAAVLFLVYYFMK